jgi:DNA-binding CsgD family transcriptional regulator/tetratricopeptide (TPR) repeat protein
VADVTSKRSLPSDRVTVEQTVHDLVQAVVRGDAATGTSVVVEGPPGIGKTHLATRIAESAASGPAAVLRVTGEPGRRTDAFSGAVQLLGRPPGSAAPEPGDLSDAAFDRVDELCAGGPVLLCADDAHHLDAATLTLLRRLVWASRSLPLAVLVTTRPDPAREPLALLVQQAEVLLRLPPMGRMTVERLIFDRTSRWPGSRLRRVLDLASGNPLFVTELLHAYERAGALAETGPDTVEARFELDLEATGLAAVIRAHLGQLDAEVRDVLAALAVWGTDIAAAELAGLLPDWPAERPDELGDLVERAISSGLVRREPAGTVGFAHDLFREVTYGELAGPARREAHRRAARVLAGAGYRPALIADHLLRGADPLRDAAAGNPELISALREAAEQTRVHAPEVTADLLGDVAAIGGAGVPAALLADQAEALFTAGRCESAEALIRERIATVADPAVAARMQLTLIRSLMNRGDVEATLTVFGRTLAIPGLPGTAQRQLEATRCWLLALAGRVPPGAELDALMARFAAADDEDAQAALLAVHACAAFLGGRPEQAGELMRAREQFAVTAGSFRNRSSSLALPAMFELAASGPAAAQAAVDLARRLSAERHAEWTDPFLGFVAGAIAFTAGDWDGAVAELDSALERAAETGTGWISQPAAVRAYIDAHRGDTAAARARLESFRHRGLPLQFGHDRPGWAELAVLEAEGAVREAATLARTLWSAARTRADRWAADLAPDVARVAVTAMDRGLAAQVGGDVAGLCPPGVSRLVRGMLAADPDAIGESAAEFAGAGRLTTEAFAREELACAAAAAGDRDRAVAALEAALAGYRRMGAVPDRDRALSRLRTLGVRRGSREAHRGPDFGWASLTVTETRIAGLVRDGLTNREIGTRLFVSPRTVQTHVSHILQKTGLRSRVEIARAVGAGTAAAT